MLRHLILGLLRTGGIRHGYSLMKEYRDASGRTMSIGNIYRELQRLRTEGLVRPASNPPGADARRISYEITDAGAAEFARWLLRPSRDSRDNPEDECSLKAFFVWKSEPHAARRVLDEWKEQLRTYGRALSRSFGDGASVGRDGHEPNGDVLPMWPGRRLRHLAIDLQFVEELRCRLESGSATNRREEPEMARASSKGAGRVVRRSGARNRPSRAS
jgi:DNA-binding PadR family transcriptional regulator